MARKPRILLVAAVLAVAVSADTWIAHGRAGHWLGERTAPALGPAVAALGRMRAWAGMFLSRSDLAAENLRLQDEAQRYRSQAAEADALRRELEFTRAAAAVRDRLPGQPVEAGMVNWYRADGASMATINRGDRDGIDEGDVVVAADGSLIGVVRNVFPEQSTVTVLGDPTLQAAARILGGAVTGLVRFGESGLILDLVQKGEDVTEGQVVVTGGNDRFPAGLVIGTVRSVDSTQSTLFSVIRVDAAVDASRTDRVLVIRP